MAIRVLVADDDLEMRRMLSTLLRRRGFKVEAAADGDEITERLEAMMPEVPDLIITDLRMPGSNGMEILDWVRRQFPSTQVILITAFGDQRTHLRAAELGAAAVFDKPFDLGDLLATVQRVVPS